MSGISAKQKVLEAIERLPDDATLEEAIEQIVFLAKIERGLAELDAGEGSGKSFTGTTESSTACSTRPSKSSQCSTVPACFGSNELAASGLPYGSSVRRIRRRPPRQVPGVPAKPGRAVGASTDCADGASRRC